MKNSLIQWAIRLLGGVSKSQWEDALAFVARWATSQLSGADKRARVLEMLKGVGITGSRANFLVESAYKWLQRIGKIPA